MIVQASTRTLSNVVFYKVVISWKASYLRNKSKYQQVQVDICLSLRSDTSSGTVLDFTIKTTGLSGNATGLAVWPDKTNKSSARLSRSRLTLSCKNKIVRNTFESLHLWQGAGVFHVWCTYLPLVDKSVFLSDTVHGVKVPVVDMDRPRVGEMDFFVAFFVCGR